MAVRSIRFPRTKHSGDRGDSTPAVRRDRDPKEPVERAKIADDLHVTPAHPEDDRSSLARIFSSHLPPEGKLMGVDGVERGRLNRTLANRTMSGRTGCAAKGFRGSPRADFTLGRSNKSFK
jgi:hypothetical protein